MKNTVLTARTWLLLIAAALLIVAGGMNFRQRLKQKPLPWDGVTWVDTKEGILARTIEPDSAAARARMLPGDVLIAIALNDRAKYETGLKASDVQIYLD